MLSFCDRCDAVVETVALHPAPSGSAVMRAGITYILTGHFVLMWDTPPFKAIIDKVHNGIPWPGLDGATIQRLPPVVGQAAHLTLPKSP